MLLGMLQPGHCAVMSLTVLRVTLTLPSVLSACVA